MKSTLLRGLFTAATLVASASIMAACSGDTDGGSAGEQNFDGTGFDPGAAGSFRLVLRDSDMQVGESAGFFVEVRDQNGGPVADVRVSCDTEEGLALIEPSDGQQLTDNGGIMSGRVGCEQVGSFRMGCRLPVGGGRRQFATVGCSGPIPSGFEGFPGAGGGGLGGGSANEPDDDELVQVTAIAFFDSGDVNTTFGGDLGDLQVDVSQGTCGEAPDLTAEPFFDSVVGIDVRNFLDDSVNFSQMNYTVENSNGAGASFTSQRFALINADEAPGQGGDGAPGERRFLGFFAKAVDGALSGEKVLNGASTNLPPNGNWISNVTFRVFGVSASGREVSASLRVSIAFGNYNRCGE